MSHVHNSPRRLAIVMVIVATLAAAVPVPGDRAAAAPADQPEAAAAAGDWIARELDAPEPSFDVFGRAGARTDVLFALASTGTNHGASRRALAELAPDAAAYVGDPGAVNPGAMAKVLLALSVNRVAPDEFLSGRNLETELRAAQRDDGSFADDVFSHALAMIALATTPNGGPPSSVDWLVGQQDADGSWPNPFAEGEVDLDTTALALQALLATGQDEAAARAADFLVAQQNGDGSWPSPFGDPNANTAGIAAQALRAAGEIVAADRAADFVMSLQLEAGGIRFTAADTEANGFATLQGVLALGGGAYHELENDPFGDVAWEDLFATDVAWLANAGVTRGCDPPANDRYCPDQAVTRGQMAAFLHRALGDTIDTGDTTAFTDTEGSVFAADIEWLAATGITRGCNPPANDRYCPDQAVTRGQMAAFLHRALGG